LDLITKPESQVKAPNPYDISRLWTANHDARDYILVGDPASKLSTTTDAGQVELPSISVSSFTPARVSHGGDQNRSKPGSGQAESRAKRLN